MQKSRFKKHSRCWYIVFAKNVDLAGLKSENNKLDIGKLETTPVYSSKLSDVVKNMLLKRLNIINWLKKVSATKATTDTSDLVKITDHNTNIGGTEKKILDHDHSKYIATQEFN